jgi:hypothetical protein
MKLSVNETPWKPIVVFLTYGGGLLIAGLMLSGMGEGSTLALVVFGSPLSATGMVFSIPVVWLLFGCLLAVNAHRLASALLITHYLIASIALAMNLTGDSDEWSLVVRVFLLDPVTTAILVLIYAVGQVLAWWWIVNGLARMRAVRRR